MYGCLHTSVQSVRFQALVGRRGSRNDGVPTRRGRALWDSEWGTGGCGQALIPRTKKENGVPESITAPAGGARRYSLVAVLLAVLVTVASLVVSQGAAHAAGACDGGAFCVYTNERWDPSGPHFEAQGNNGDWHVAFPTVSNGDESVINNGTSGMAVHVYDYPGGVGFKYCARKGSKFVIPAALDDDGRSHYWSWSTSGCF